MRGARVHDDAAADERVFEAGDVLDAAALHQDRVVDARAHDLDALADAGEGADVRVDDARPTSDDDRAPHDRALDDRALVDRDAPEQAALFVDAAAHLVLEPRVEHRRVGQQKVVFLARVEPPRGDALEVHLALELDQLGDGVGDLELAPRRGPNALDRVEDGGPEEVDAHQGEVALRLGGLLDQAHDPPSGVDLGDAEGRGVRHLFQHDRGRERLPLEKGLDRAPHLGANQVVAEVHAKGLVASQKGRGRLHRVGEAGRLGLLDVRDARAPARPVAHRRLHLAAGLGRDDDADVDDARVDQVVDDVEKNRPVGHRHQLLRARVRERPQTRARAAGEDESLHRRRAFHRPAAASRAPRPAPLAPAPAARSTPETPRSDPAPPAEAPQTGSNWSRNVRFRAFLGRAGAAFRPRSNRAAWPPRRPPPEPPP